MKFIRITSLLLIFLVSCKNNAPKPIIPVSQNTEVVIPRIDYELIIPDADIKALLILFGGYPEGPEDIKREFGIEEMAIAGGVAVMYMHFNHHLWLEEEEKASLTESITEALASNELPTNNVFIGGFSSGGNVSLLIANHLIESNSAVKPKGVFIVDSPVDLLELYRCSERNIKNNFSTGSVRESQRTVYSFDTYFGKIDKGIEKYEHYSPYTYASSNIENLKSLKEVQLRLYTEPDTLWWKTQRMNEYQDMNAFYIKKLADDLREKLNHDRVALIETKNQGIRANGMRHPHSWSIVDKEDLLRWILQV